MAPVECFEDLIAWQKARALTAAVYRACRRDSVRRDYALCNQLRRAAVSVMANIAEGFERGGRGEFHQFLSTAKASRAEVRSHLYVAMDAGYLQRPEAEALLGQAVEVGRILGGLRKAVARQRAVQT